MSIRDETPLKDPEPGRVEPGESPGGAVRWFLKRGEAFIEEILDDNEALRLRVVQLESKLQEGRTPVPPPVAASELRKIFEDLQREQEELSRRLDQVAQETESYKHRYQEIEEENDRLANLFVSAYQLHSTLEFGEVIQVILEILLNFVGAGRFALLIQDGPGGPFRAISAYGLPLEQVPSLQPDGPELVHCLKNRKPWFEDSVSGGFDPRRPLVCIPLKLGEEVMGAVTIYSYLEQKDEISAIDRELFSLLGDHAGGVIESARLQTMSPPVTSRYEVCLSLLQRDEA